MSSYNLQSTGDKTEQSNTPLAQAALLDRPTPLARATRSLQDILTTTRRKTADLRKQFYSQIQQGDDPLHFTPGFEQDEETSFRDLNIQSPQTTIAEAGPPDYDDKRHIDNQLFQTENLEPTIGSRNLEAPIQSRDIYRQSLYPHLDVQETSQSNNLGFPAKPIIKNEQLTNFRHINTLNSYNSDQNRPKEGQILTNSSIKSESDRLTHYKNVDTINQLESERVPTAPRKRVSALNGSMHSSIIKLKPFYGNDFESFSAFLTKFNKFCALHNIPELQKSDVIHFYLS